MIRRIFVFLLILTLVIGQILPSGISFAQNISEPTQKKFAAHEEAVPQELGKLKSAYFHNSYEQIFQSEGIDKAVSKIAADKQPFVILIEDAHASSEAQMNIANLIQHARRQWGVKLIALEGAQGKAPLEEVRSMPGGETKEEILDFYLREALLTGPEYEALRSPEAYEVIGVEENKLYEADRQVYLELSNNRSEISRILVEVQKKLNRSKEAVYSKELLAFDSKERQFQKNSFRYFPTFVPYLVKLAGQKGIMIPEDSELAALARVMQDASGASSANLEQELVSFRNEYPNFKKECDILEKRFLPRKNDFNFVVTGAPPEIPALFLYRYKALRSYLNLASLRYRMNSEKVFGEIDELSLKIKKLLSRGSKELELDEEARELDLVGKILYLEARPEDLKTSFDLEAYSKKIGLSQLYKKARYFYELAEKRDETLALKTLTAIEESKVEPKAAVLVAGGFHAEGIQRIFEKMKVSYIVLSPQFNADLMNDQLYRMRLKEDDTLVTSTLSQRRRMFRSSFPRELYWMHQYRAEGVALPGAFSRAVSLGRSPEPVEGQAGVEIWKGDEKVENAVVAGEIEKFVRGQVAQGKAKNVSKVVFHLKAKEQKLSYDLNTKEIHFYTAKTNLEKAFGEFQDSFSTVLAQIPGFQISRRAFVGAFLGVTAVGALVLTLKNEAFSKPKQEVEVSKKISKGTNQKWTVIYTSHGTVQDFEKIRPLLDQALEEAGGKKAKFTIIEESGYFSLGNLPAEIRPRLIKNDYLKDPVLREAAQKAIDRVNGTAEHNAGAVRSNRVSLRYYYNRLLAERHKGKEVQLSDFQMSIFAYLADKADQGYNIWLEWEKLHLESALDHFYWDYIEQENAVRLYRQGKLEEYLANEKEVIKAKVRVVRLRDEKFFGQQLPDTLKRDPDRHIITMRGSAHVGNEKWAPQELQASGVRPQTEYVLRALDSMGRMERGEEHLGLEEPEWYVEKAYLLGKPLDPKKEREFYLREAVTIALAPMNPHNMDSEERWRRFAPIVWTVKPEQIEKLFAIMKDLANQPGMSDEQAYALVLAWFNGLNLPKEMLSNLTLYPQIAQQLEFYKKWAVDVIDSWEKGKKASPKVEGKALGTANLKRVLSKAEGASLGVNGVFDEKKWDETVAYLPAETIEERMMTLFAASNWKEEPASQLSEQAKLALLSKALSISLERSDSEKIAQFLRELLERSQENPGVYLPEANQFISSYLAVYSIENHPSGRPIKISEVIAMYNEQNRMQPASSANPNGEDFLRVKIRQLNELFSINPKVVWQLVLVDDGDKDPNRPERLSSGELALQILEKEYPELLKAGQIKVLFVDRKKKIEIGGRKGSGIITGLRQAVTDGADHVIFTDADISTHLGLSGLLLEALIQSRSDAVIGSRRMKGAVIYGRSPQEKRSSMVYNFLVRTLLGLNYQDTQTGFKAFKRELLERVLPLDTKGNYQKDFVYNFSFDTILLVRIQNVGGHILEIPITWIGSREESTIRLKDNFTMAYGVWKQRAFVRRPGTITTYNPEVRGKSLGKGEPIPVQQIHTWYDVITALNYIAEQENVADQLDHIRQLDIWIREKKTGLQLIDSDQFDFKQYPSDIAVQTKEAALKILEKTHPENMRPVKELILTLPFAMDDERELRNVLWGIAEEIDDTYLNDKFSEELRHNLHRSGFNAQALPMVRAYLSYIKSDPGFERKANEVGTAENQLMWSIREPDQKLKASLAEQNPDPQDLAVLGKLEKLERTLTILFEGTYRKDVFEKWLTHPSVTKYPKIEEKIRRINEPGQTAIEKLIRILSAREEIRKETQRTNNYSDIYDLSHLQPSLGSYAELTIEDVIREIQASNNPLKKYQTILRLLFNDLYHNGLLARSAVPWLDMLRAPGLSRTQMRDVIRQLEVELKRTLAKWQSDYNEACESVFGEDRIIRNRAVGRFIKERYIFGVVLDRVIPAAKKDLENILKEKNDGFIQPLAAKEVQQKRLIKPYMGIIHIDDTPSQKGDIYFNYEIGRYGSKGSGLVHMKALGMPVPSGFIIPAEVFQDGLEARADFEKAINKHLDLLEAEWSAKLGRSVKLGDVKSPMFLAVRPSSAFVMPGILETLTDLGFTRPIATELLKPSMPLAIGSFMRFMESMAIVLGISKKEFYADVVQKYLDRAGVPDVYHMKKPAREAMWADMKQQLKDEGVYGRFEELYANPRKQVIEAIRKIAKMWDDPRVKSYRRSLEISDAWQSAIIVQAYVFGDTQPNSGTGVALSRERDTQRKILTGDWVKDHQGESLAQGRVRPESIDKLRETMPQVFRELNVAVHNLDEYWGTPDGYFGTPQIVEFTIQNGKLWMLQTGSDTTKRADEKFGTLRFRSNVIEIGKGDVAYGAQGGLRGWVVFSPQEALLPQTLERFKQSPDVESVIVISRYPTPEDSPDLIETNHILHEKYNKRLALLTEKGGLTSHAAVIANQNGIPTIVNTRGLEIRQENTADFMGETIKSGDLLTMDFSAGRIFKGAIPVETTAKSLGAAKELQAAYPLDDILRNARAENGQIDLEPFRVTLDQVLEGNCPQIRLYLREISKISDLSAEKIIAMAGKEAKNDPETQLVLLKSLTTEMIYRLFNLLRDETDRTVHEALELARNDIRQSIADDLVITLKLMFPINERRLPAQGGLEVQRAQKFLRSADHDLTFISKIGTDKDTIKRIRDAILDVYSHLNNSRSITMGELQNIANKFLPDDVFRETGARSLGAQGDISFKRRIREFTSYQNVSQGLDLVGYAKKLRAQKGINRIYFDLDQTLFRSKGYVSSSRWRHDSEEEYSRGMTPEYGRQQMLQAWAYLGHEYRQIKNGFFYELIEPREVYDISKMIQQLKREDFEVVGLTRRVYSRDKKRTEEILRGFGIELPVVYTEEDGADKVSVLELYESLRGKAPALVIDDQRENLEQFLKNKKSLVGLHYTNPASQAPDDWTYQKYMQLAERSYEEGLAAEMTQEKNEAKKGYGYSLEYYFNAFFKILKLEGGMTREEGYKQLREIHDQLRKLVNKRPADWEKLDALLERESDPQRACLWFDEEARRKRQTMTAPLFGEDPRHLEKKLLDLYSPSVLQGRIELIKILKKKVRTAYHLAQKLSQAFELSPEDEHILCVAALVNDLGKGYTPEKLNLHFGPSGKRSDKDRSDLALVARDSLAIVDGDEERRLLQGKEPRQAITIPERSRLLIYALNGYFPSEAMKEQYMKSRLMLLLKLLDLTTDFSNRIYLSSSQETSKDLMANEAIVTRWFRTKIAADEYPLFESAPHEKALAVFQSVFQQQEKEISHLGSNVAEPTFQDTVTEWQKHFPFSYLALRSLKESPEASYKHLKANLELLVRKVLVQRSYRADPIELSKIARLHQEILNNFGIEYFKARQEAFRKRDVKNSLKLIESFETLIKRLVELLDPDFEEEVETYREQRQELQDLGQGFRSYLVIEENPDFNWYLQMKILRRYTEEDRQQILLLSAANSEEIESKKENAKVVILSATNPNEAFQKIEETRDLVPAFTSPEMVVTDLGMGKDHNAGWDLARKVREYWPNALILLQSDAPYPIMADIDAAIYKENLLYFESYLDMMETEFTSRDEAALSPEGQILKLFNPHILKGDEKWINRLKRKAMLTYQVSDSVAAEYGLSKKARELMRLVAVIDEFGMGANEERLRLYMTMFKEKIPLDLDQEILLGEFIDDGFNLLEDQKDVLSEANHELITSRATRLFMQALHASSKDEVRLLEQLKGIDRDLPQAVRIVRLVSRFFSAKLSYPFIRFEDASSDRLLWETSGKRMKIENLQGQMQEVDSWLKSLVEKGEIDQRIKAAAEPVLRSSANSNISFGALLGERVSKLPLFQRKIFRLSIFQKLSQAGALPFIRGAGLTPSNVYNVFNKYLRDFEVTSPFLQNEKQEIVGEFNEGFFADILRASESHRDRFLNMLARFESRLKRLAEDTDLQFNRERQRMIDFREMCIRENIGFKKIWVVEDSDIIRDTIVTKIQKRNLITKETALDSMTTFIRKTTLGEREKSYRHISIATLNSGAEAIELLERSKGEEGPDLVITDLDMETSPAGPQERMGWKVVDKVHELFPKAMVLVQSSNPYPIERQVEGAIKKEDLLFLEYVLDLYEEWLVEHRPERGLSGSSLGSVQKTPATYASDDLVVAMKKNIMGNPEPAYFLLPSSLLPKIDGASLGFLLQSDQNNVNILWDGDGSRKKLETPAERFDYLTRLGLAKYMSKKNFSPNVTNKNLDAAPSLAEQVQLVSKVLEARGITSEHISFLKPGSLKERVTGALSLREGAPYPLFLMHYLIQTAGLMKNDLLGVFTQDPRLGDFIASVDRELERIFSEQFAMKLRAIAA